MALDQHSVESSTLMDGLLRMVLILAVVLAVALAAAVTLDWTLAGDPVFELTADPVGDLPF